MLGVLCHDLSGMFYIRLQPSGQNTLLNTLKKVQDQIYIYITGFSNMRFMVLTIIMGNSLVDNVAEKVPRLRTDLYLLSGQIHTSSLVQFLFNNARGF